MTGKSTQGKNQATSYPPPFTRDLLHPRYLPAWFGVGLAWLLAQLPGRWRRRLGERLGDLMWRRHAKRRRIVLTNLEWCFPDLEGAERDRLTRDYFRSVATTMLDFSMIWFASEKRLERFIVLRGGEHLRPLLEAGRPVILLAPHSIGLDFGGAALARDFPLVTMLKPMRNPLLDWWAARGRARFGCLLFRREDGMRPVIKALRNGHAFYYMPDEDLGPENSLFVPFFGVPAATITALPRLARLAKAAVVPFVTRYEVEQGRYVGTLFPPLENYPGEDEAEDVARMNRELERLIRLAPEQYMWSLRLFQSRPDGSPPPYAMKGKAGSGHRPAP